MQHFASDNYAGICPEALHALIAANNSGHEPAYGDDSWTNQVCDRLRELFQNVASHYGYNLSASLAGGSDYAWGGAGTTACRGCFPVP